MAIWTVARSKKDLPAASGVYVIRLGERCLYVGKAHNIRKRFYLHQIEINRIAYKDFKGDVSAIEISYTLMPIEDLIAEERYYINLFSPELNTKRR